MIKSFNYTNSKGETKKHIVAVISETPDYLMSLDLGSVVHKIIEDEKWFDNFYMIQNNKVESKDIVDLIHQYNLITNEIETVKDYSVNSDDITVFYNENHTSISNSDNLKGSENIKHFDLLGESETIPNFIKAKNEYNKIIDVFKNRESIKYNDLKESRSTEKKPIEGFDNEWMKSFKNFKKSGIQKEV